MSYEFFVIARAVATAIGTSSRFLFGEKGVRSFLKDILSRGRKKRRVLKQPGNKLVELPYCRSEPIGLVCGGRDAFPTKRLVQVTHVRGYFLETGVFTPTGFVAIDHGTGRPMRFLCSEVLSAHNPETGREIPGIRQYLMSGTRE